MTDRTEMRSPDGTRVADYDYELADERIARYPAERRDESRLLVVPEEGSFEHLRFKDLTEILQPGDLLVVNESRVRPARLLGRKPTGAPAEVLLLNPAESSEVKEGDGVGGGPQVRAGPRDWIALVRPGSKLKPGRVVEIASDLRIEILDGAPGGARRVRLHADGPVEEAIERHGHMPLPPYIEREDEPLDQDRYQTVYARTAGSVAAPTAGLHFTDDLLDRLGARGVRRASVTLHVGIGTFRPVEVDDAAEHEMHSEAYTVPPAVVEAVSETRASGGRIWAVGTTVVRTLESAARPEGRVQAGSGATDLFIRPPYDFKVVDGLITNFHLPRSTLLMLVSALGGYGRVMEAYRTAVVEGYRFYSYGDAMVLLPRQD